MYYDGPEPNDSAICPVCGGGGGFHRFGMCWTCEQNALAEIGRDRRAMAGSEPVGEPVTSEQTTAARVAEMLDDV